MTSFTLSTSACARCERETACSVASPFCLGTHLDCSSLAFAQCFLNQPPPNPPKMVKEYKMGESFGELVSPTSSRPSSGLVVSLRRACVHAVSAGSDVQHSARCDHQGGHTRATVGHRPNHLPRGQFGLGCRHLAAGRSFSLLNAPSARCACIGADGDASAQAAEIRGLPQTRSHSR